MPLTFLSPGMEGCVKKITGKDSVRCLLESLGFVAGGKVRMISSSGDNVILGIRGSRIAISRRLADRIHI